MLRVPFINTAAVGQCVKQCALAWAVSGWEVGRNNASAERIWCRWLRLPVSGLLLALGNGTAAETSGCSAIATAPTCVSVAHKCNHWDGRRGAPIAIRAPVRAHLKFRGRVRRQGG